MKRVKSLLKVILMVLVFGVTVQKAEASLGWNDQGRWGHRGRHYDGGGHHHRHHRHHRHGYHHQPYFHPTVIFPSKYVTVIIGGRTYYRCDGRYYRRHRGEYIVVDPSFDHDDDHHFVSHGREKRNKSYAKVDIDDDTDSFTVNVPRSYGGYQGVVLTKKGRGFVGPQGEFYSEFPSVEQLKEMYGK